MIAAKNGALITPTHSVHLADRAVQLGEEGRDGDVERDPGHQRAAEQPHHVGVEDEQRQRQHQTEQPRQHQHLDRIEAEGAHRVDLLVDLHRADLGGEGAARAAGDDDRRQQHPELAQDRDAEQVDRVDLGAEPAQLIGALIGHDDADQKRQQPDDRQRVEPDLLHLHQRRDPAQAARSDEQLCRGLGDQSGKRRECP